MKLLQRIFRYKYLTRLIATCILFFLLPCMLAMGLLTMNSYRQMLAANEAYYWELTNTFERYCTDKLSDINRCAQQLSIDSRESKKDAAALVLTDPSSYDHWTALRALAECTAATDYSFGVYYQDGSMLYRNCKYSVNSLYASFFSKKAMVEAPDDFAAFFSAPLDGSFRYYSDGKTLLVGIPTRLGNQRSAVLLVFWLDADSIDAARFLGDGAASMAQFAIYDANGLQLLSTTHDIIPELPAQALESTEAPYRLNSEQGERTVFARNGLLKGLTFVSIVPFEGINESMYLFYSTMKLSLSMEILIFLLMGALMVYFNYLPIHKLTHTINPDIGDDELAEISSYINRLNADLSEQKLLMMDYLVNNILCGTPIPQGILKRMGAPTDSGFYCVMALFGHSVKTPHRAELARQLQRQLGTTLFITDLLGADHMVIICMMTTSDVEVVEEKIRSWLTTHVAFPINLMTGPVVTSINDIHRSYEACVDLPQRETRRKEVLDQPDASSATRQIDQLRDNVLAYLHENFTNCDLSQSSVADHFGISTYSLSRLFKNHVGIGFSEYVTSHRLEAAKVLLLSTDKSINEIAAEVGIPNSNYFSRLFKTNIGLTPLKYRASGGREDCAAP